MTGSISPLWLKSVTGKRRYELLKDFRVQFEDGTGYIVPGGFETDLISSPRMMWWFIPPGDYGREAAVVHDYLLESGKPRKEADKVFLRILKLMGIKKHVMYFMYYGVRFYSRFLRVKKKLS